MREARTGFEWTDTTLDRLRALWAEGHSTAEIGRRMDISKNAVIGKAHRLNLAARPSPLRSADPSAPKRAPARRPVPKLADIMAITSALPVVATTVLHTSPVPSSPAPTAPAIMTNHALPPARAGRTHPCCWPIGDPGTRTFRFCEADAPLGKSYCTEHATVAYAMRSGQSTSHGPTLSSMSL